MVEMTSPLLTTAANLADRHPLRAYDAVQLATALDLNHRWQAGGLGGITLITADQELLTAATAEQLTVDNLN